MKKVIHIIVILFAIFVFTFSTGVYAVALDTINITTTKTTVNPGENVTVNIDFGKELGAFTVDVAYDNNLFEYVSSEGGTSNDTGTKVRTIFYDTTGGANPRSNLSVTFKAKDVLTSNPTDFSITAEGLAGPEPSVTYDDITIPIVKSVVVEPKYVDYDIKLEYTGDIIKNVEKDMKLVTSSTMGKNYEHTRIIAEVTTPENATVQLLGTDNAGLEHDIIQSGWGDANGEAIGGKDVVKELAVRGTFSDSGKYSITFKLINRDDSDAVITSKTVDITVKNTAAEPDNEINENNKPNEEIEKEETEPSKMPQTGNTVYGYFIPVIMILTVAFVALKKKN